MQEHDSIFTNNQWKKGLGPLFTSYNPATGEILWQGREADKEQVDEAVRNAQAAFPDWSGLTIDERSQYLGHFGEILKHHTMTMAEIISKETGKPLWDSKGEVASMINKIDISLEAYGRRCAGMIRDQGIARSITRHRPHGPVAVFGPFNFPGHLPGGHIIPALLAGNTIIFKPSELTPAVAETLISFWNDVGLPPGVINLIQGGKETGQALIHNPHIQGLFFTGSYQTGLYLSQLFGSYPQKILALEMGGNNPLVVSQIANPTAAAYLTVQSAYLSSGQRCTCARRLIVPESPIGNEFISSLLDLINTIKVGPYTDVPEPYMGPLISESHAKRILEAQDFLRAKGGKSLIEMKNFIPDTGFLSPGLMDVTAIKDRPDEEIFGPFLQLIRTKDLQEAIEEANRTKFGLAAGIFTQSLEEYNQFYRQARAGIINWNMQLTGASSASPFGGIGCSGNHRPSAYYAADYCSYPVASLETPSLKLPTNLLPGIELKNDF
ncbi:succinylglutamate-semialdehyde dehydrogenase [Candidatus Protochlamydia phocaeensis]|uniref:succinylglutamate-semialdehyde dehydrogenase n=1 Tax=Candidatus Protochlamydia phocaeensis TaxID=1414722 RepID=UPI0008391FD3|nr:succinylglutamate-semialdehyde dehydrogenase [Candidatus Protochlamydia phocaeensis]